MTSAVAAKGAVQTPILHHFDASPFAEKVRLILGFKGLAWRSVQIPMAMPKPDLVALTGGYRKTPLLQIGADIYCDTALIARVLDNLGGGVGCGAGGGVGAVTTLYPATAPLATAFAQWADWQLFWTVVDFGAQPAVLEHRWRGMPAEQVKALYADRAPFRAAVPRRTAIDAAADLAAMLGALDAQLADGRRWLFGEPSIADFAVAHPVWYLRRGGPVAEALFAPLAQLCAWHDGMLSLGHGRPSPLDSSEALTIAAAADGHAPCAVEAGVGFDACQAVSVAATDYGTEPVIGSLVGLSATEVVLERADARVGTLHLHFPRHGFQIKPAG